MTIVSALVFFFQAEDGIRDLYVTGVQTCALPIYTVLVVVIKSELDRTVFANHPVHFHGPGAERRRAEHGLLADIPQHIARSEERRVGKECRWWWLMEEEIKMRGRWPTLHTTVSRS